MKTQAEIVIKAKDYAESIGNKDGLSAYDYVMGYNQCQQDIAKEIKSLIDMYNSKIDELLIDFNDGCSVITLTEISTFQDIVTNLQKLL